MNKNDTLQQATPKKVITADSNIQNNQLSPVKEPIAVRKFYTLLGENIEVTSTLQINSISNANPNGLEDNLGEFVDKTHFESSSTFANLIQNVFPSPCVQRITEDDESDDTLSDENFPIPVVKPKDLTSLVPYEPLMSSDLSETDDVQIERYGGGDSCVDETSRDELDELSDAENVDLTSFCEDSLEAMYYRIRKDEILIDKSRKQMSAGKSMERNKVDNYEDHGISEQPTEASNVDDESSKENNGKDCLYDLHGVSEQLTTEASNLEDEEEEKASVVKNDRFPNPVEFAIEQQRMLVERLHHSATVNYEDVVTPLDELEENDQYPDSLEIRRKMWASSVSETDSDYVDLSAHRLTRDDFNISTALDHMSSSESGSTIVSAATKIQAGARGFLTRRRIRRSSGGTSAASVDKTCSFGNAAIDKSLEDLIEKQELLTMDEAVIKVQRFYRMYRLRNQPTEKKQQRLILTHECDDSQCPGDDDEENDQSLGQSQEQGLADVIEVRLEQKKYSQTPELDGEARSLASPQHHADTEIDPQPVEKNVSDQQPLGVNDVFEPAKIAANDAQRDWSPNNQPMSIALSSVGDSFEMDSVHHQRRRLTLQRGDAVQRYSSPDESSSPQNTTQTSAIIKTASPNPVDTPSTATSIVALSPTQSKYFVFF